MLRMLRTSHLARSKPRADPRMRHSYPPYGCVGANATFVDPNAVEPAPYVAWGTATTTLAEVAAAATTAAAAPAADTTNAAGQTCHFHDDGTVRRRGLLLEKRDADRGCWFAGALLLDSVLDEHRSQLRRSRIIMTAICFSLSKVFCESVFARASRSSAGSTQPVLSPPSSHGNV